MNYAEYEIDNAFKLLILINTHYWKFAPEEVRLLTGATMSLLEFAKRNIEKQKKGAQNNVNIQ